MHGAEGISDEPEVCARVEGERDDARGARRQRRRHDGEMRPADRRRVVAERRGGELELELEGCTGTAGYHVPGAGPNVVPGAGDASGMYAASAVRP
jgi:hypothetical protein